MPVFRFLAPNIWMTIGTENINANGNSTIVKVEEGERARAFRGAACAKEVGRMDDKVVKRYIAELNKGAKHPFPDMKKPVVLVGRGMSSARFWERYPDGEYTRIGINPGSKPIYAEYAGSDEAFKGKRHAHESDGHHGDEESLSHMEAICTADGHYFSQPTAPSHFYCGPVLSRQRFSEAYKGPGTFHGCDKLARDEEPRSTLVYALNMVSGARADEVIMAGVDFDADGYTVGKDEPPDRMIRYNASLVLLLKTGLIDAAAADTKVYFDKQCRVSQDIHGRPLWPK